MLPAHQVRRHILHAHAHPVRHQLTRHAHRAQDKHQDQETLPAALIRAADHFTIGLQGLREARPGSSTKHHLRANKEHLLLFRLQRKTSCALSHSAASKKSDAT